MAGRESLTDAGWLLKVLVRAAVLAVTAAGSSVPMHGCEKPGNKAPATATPPATSPVTIAGKTFTLECALLPSKQFRGLSGRTDIPADGGMIFVFPRAEERYFVMRDCPVDIDIIFLDAQMKITKFHEMKVEPPRSAEETPNDTRGVNDKYESRLARYHSGFPAQYALEFKGGTIKGLNLKEGQKIDIDPDLKRWAR